MSGTQTAPLVIRIVDKGRIVPDDGGPVSQMQKIALQRINPDGTRHYLSAAGPMPTAPGSVPPTSPNLAHQTGTHPLLFQAPRVREEVKDGQRVMTDEVDDFLCWTIVGICSFCDNYPRVHASSSGQRASISEQACHRRQGS